MPGTFLSQDLGISAILRQDLSVLGGFRISHLGCQYFRLISTKNIIGISIDCEPKYIFIEIIYELLILNIQ